MYTLKAIRMMVEYTNPAIMTRTKYMAKRPMNRFTPSTQRTQRLMMPGTCFLLGRSGRGLPPLSDEAYDCACLGQRLSENGSALSGIGNALSDFGKTRVIPAALRGRAVQPCVGMCFRVADGHSPNRCR